MTSGKNRKDGENFETSPTLGGVGESSASGSRLGPGATFGRYTILGRLGAGGMGVVYAAYDPDLDRKVALKLLLPSLRGGMSQERLLREAQAMARLSHPNVVTVHDVGQVKGRTYISMEFVEGQNLDQWLAEDDRSPGEVLRLFLAAGKGLAAAHRAGLIHRDFKPANVLLGVDGRVRVADFGLARGAEHGSWADELFEGGETVKGEAVEKAKSFGGHSPLAGPLTVPGTIVGTPRYMAPEQVLEREADAASDQFSFCLTLFEALFGLPAFGTGDMMQLARRSLAGEIKPIPSGTGVSGRARRALIRGLRAEPGERFSSMDVLLSELGHDPAAIRRRWMVVGMGVLLVIAGVALVAQFVVARRNLCSGGQDRVAAVWNEGRAAAVTQAFEGTGMPYAAEAAVSVSDMVSARGEAWVAAFTDVCEATRVRGEVSEDLLDRQMACLDQRLLEMDRLLVLLQAADEGLVERAVDSVRNLPALEPCTHGAEMLNLEPLPLDPERVAAIEVVLADLADVEALKVTGQFEEALARGGRAAEAAQKTGYAPLVAQAMQLQGNLEIEMGQSDEALTSLRQGLVAAEKGGTDRLAVAILNELVWVQGVMLQQFERADFLSQLAEAGLHRISDDGALMAEILYSRAAILGAEGRYDEGLGLQERAYRAVVAAEGAESLGAAFAENQLADALFSVGSYAEALEHYQVAASLRERYLGPNHPRLAPTLTSLGSTLSNLGRDDEALVILARALDINEAVYGPGHPNLAVTLNNIAYAQEGLGRLSEALETHERALVIIRQTWGADHPQTAYAHLNRVSIYRKLEQWDLALEEARAAERILSEAFGSDHPLYAYAANAEGVILLLMGRPRQALEPLETAVRIREGVTTDPLVLAQTRFSLAKALWVVGADRARALRLVEQSRAVFVAEGERAAEDLELMETWKLER